MRYRPLGTSGMAVSALTMRLRGEHCPGDANRWVTAVHAAFENGVNSFEIIAPSAELLRGVAIAAEAVERRLICFSLRLPAQIQADDVFRLVEGVLKVTNLQFLDLVIADGDGDLHNDVIWMLEDLRATGKIKRMGIAGQGDGIATHIGAGSFDVLVSPFNILSGWRERLRVRSAAERQMSVIGDDYYPEDARNIAEPKRVKRRWFSKPSYALAGLGSYNFLHDTHAWKAEEICLGFALTEPALASVAVDIESAAHLESLAATTERDLPAAVAAQIEMARFSAERSAGTERRTERRTA
jgi:aryl-alcohol dehydrogenase-like predicted oxidoreductase